MTKLVVLGTANVIPDERHGNSHLLLTASSGSTLIDCGGCNPIVSVRQAGVDPNDVHTLIVTHFHPDHVSGLPGFLLSLWVMGRQRSLCICGLRSTLGKCQAMMNLFGWVDWPQFFPVVFVELEMKENVPVLETPDYRIVASPTRHFVPTIAVRITSTGGRSAVYSSDSSPCDSVVRLASGADILLHEASGAQVGHSSAAMAGSIARLAGVGRLALIHYDVKTSSDALMAEAQATFDGEITLTQDLDEFEL
jgi:ribonuclease Z